jgi:hypothetical protein
VTYSTGGPPIRCDAPANSGCGGGGANCRTGPQAGGAGGSGVVAIRYSNPSAPTTTIFTGGNTICCTGGCIIHVFNTSGFINIGADFSIN